MRSRTLILLAGFLLQAPLAHAQVINGQSTYESNLQPRPPVELEDSALVPKPQPPQDDRDAQSDRDTPSNGDTNKSLYPSR